MERPCHGVGFLRRSARHVGHANLGVVVHERVKARMPVEAESPMALITNGPDETPRSPHALQSGAQDAMG
jgi:hypothetical protein